MNSTPSCQNCRHAATIRISAGQGHQRQLVDCAKNHWPTAITVVTLYSHSARYSQLARKCDDFAPLATHATRQQK